MQYTQQFSSIQSFYKYLCDTPFNDAFRWHRHSSVEASEHWTGTSSFEEAVDLMRNGWTDMSTKLTQKLNAVSKQQPIKQQRNVLSVAGYQPVVPLYLAGVPTNMVSKQLVAVKSKVITITKLVNYNSGISAYTIEQESIKAMLVVKKLEAQGYRCNLNIALGSCAGGREILVRVRIKNANEKLNVSKLAFPMVHPSMLRRLLLRYLEVYPETTTAYCAGYGRPADYSTMCKAFPDDIVLPSVWTQDVEKIGGLKDLVASV